MDEVSLLNPKAIQSVNEGMLSYCKFLSANDTGLTGGHQSGIYIAKNAVPILFDKPGVRGENKKKTVKIKWQDDFTTEGVFTYYGIGTRNEYRITHFGRGFPLLRAEHTGDLFVFVKMNPEEYVGYVLSTDDDINQFLEYFGMSPTETGRLIEFETAAEKQKENSLYEFICNINSFPKADEMSEEARTIYTKVYDHVENIQIKPDEQLLNWIAMEYELFRRIEDKFYGKRIQHGFPSMQDFIDVANSLLNRRKSRAGKSLENHLEYLFKENGLIFDTQVRTEEHKKPDFVFPGSKAYHNPEFDTHKLIVLGAKTTCKDRWRQVITEADRTDIKYLCTLQQGISPQQLHEMKTEHVVLVVPKPYIATYPKEYRETIFDLAKFMEFVRETAEK